MILFTSVCVFKTIHRIPNISFCHFFQILFNIQVLQTGASKLCGTIFFIILIILSINNDTFLVGLKISSKVIKAKLII
jgi:hypothetical protein